MALNTTTLTCCNFLTMRVPDEVYYRNASCAPNQTSTFSSLSLRLCLCWWTICPRGYHPPSQVISTLALTLFIRFSIWLLQAVNFFSKLRSVSLGFFFEFSLCVENTNSREKRIFRGGHGKSVFFLTLPIFPVETCRSCYYFVIIGVKMFFH